MGRLILTRRAALAAVPAFALVGCGGTPARSAAAGDRWTRLVEAAPFPGSYGFPVHVAADGRFVALHPRGTWSSRDGVGWVRERLPDIGINHSYHPLVQHRGTTWSLAVVAGNYERFGFDPLVRRTGDYRTWATLGRSASLPRLVFPTVASFHDQLWLIGGFDGAAYSNAIWRSDDGLAWRKVAEAPWAPRMGARWLVFRDRLWLIGGGIIDGPINSDVWSSADGLAWTREADKLADPQPFGFTPQVFDNRIWLIGANRSGEFASEMLVSSTGRDWQPVRAPWSPRGLPATWTDGRRLYVTGGKYSTPDPATGEQRFTYSNDVWAMAASEA